MLYEQIRYAEEIRKLYRLRHLLPRAHHPAIDALLGYPKNSTQFYRIKKVLQATRILDEQGRFIESPPNLWIAELTLNANRAQMKALGHQVQYTVFLTLVMKPQTMTRELPEELFFKRQTIHYALNRLLRVKAVTRKGESRLTNITADEKLRKWLLRYIEFSKLHADATGDISYIFGAVPAHVSGPAAHNAVHYEPGRPIGPSDMVISTYEPFRTLWVSMIRDVRYFKEYPKAVKVEIANPSDKVVWVGRIPYSRPASDDWRQAK